MGVASLGHLAVERGGWSVPMVRGYRWMYRTARPAIDMSTMPDQSCIFYDIGNYPSRDHDTRKYHLSFGDACQVPLLCSVLLSIPSSPARFVTLEFFHSFIGDLLTKTRKASSKVWSIVRQNNKKRKIIKKY